MSKDYKEFISTLSPDVIEKVLSVNSQNGKIGFSETIMIFIALLEKYHEWLNA